MSLDGHRTHDIIMYQSCLICSIDDDFVPHDGDEVEYKTLLIPPKLEKTQAVHVVIIKPIEGVKHERWDQIVQHGTPH